MFTESEAGRIHPQHVNQGLKAPYIKGKQADICNKTVTIQIPPIMHFGTDGNYIFVTKDSYMVHCGDVNFTRPDR